MSAQKVLVLGGGFGGITAANWLRRLLPKEHEIVVVNKSERFHVGAGKTWIMLGERSYGGISQFVAALLEPGSRFLQAEALKLDLANRSVETDHETLQWDYLVVALGADLNDAALPGLAAAAHTFYTIEGAQRLSGVLDRFTGGDVAILIAKTPFKCPPAPYEAAMLLRRKFASSGLAAAKARIAIYTVEPAPMPTAGPEMGQFIRDELAQREIEFHPQKKTARVDGGARRMVFEDGTEARYDLLIAIPPHEAPKVARDAGLVGQSGWIPVDPLTLQAKCEAASGLVYAAGDITAVQLPGCFKSGAPLSLPKAGVFAEAHGQVIARQIAAKILGNAPNAFFDGKGFCYIETGGGRAVRAEGSFFDLPHPVMLRRSPDEAQYRDKLEWVARQLLPIR